MKYLRGHLQAKCLQEDQLLLNLMVDPPLHVSMYQCKLKQIDLVVVDSSRNHHFVYVHIMTLTFFIHVVDTSWQLAELNGKQIAKVSKGTYGQHTYDQVDLCLESGKYNFTIEDEYRDGICCAYGNGFVKISIDGREVLHFKSFSRQVSEILNVGFDPSSYMNR